MRRPTTRSVAALLVLALLAAACGGDDAGDGGGLAALLDDMPTSSTNEPDPDSSGGDGDGDAEGTIEWSDPSDDGWEQGTVEVPLDHDDPDGETIEIAVVRHRATDEDARIGPLLLNPGGPGASGIDLALQTRFIFPTEFFERFDIIGFDPRGVGRSTAVTCGDAEFLDEYTAVDPVPDSPEEEAAADALVREFADNCGEESGDLLPHLSTVSAARDMDRIREGLGVEQITYIGFSYGTNLGATYIELHPDRVRAAVLDGAYSRSLSPVEMAVGQATGFEQSIDAFLEWCATTSCELGATGDAGTTLMRVLDAVDREPLPTNDGDGRELTVGLAWTGVIMAMYSPGLWPVLDAALVAARGGDGSQLLFLADQYNSRDLDGEYDNSTFAFTSISCADAGPLGPGEEEQLAEELLAAAPRIGPVFLGLPSPCEYWPVNVGGDAPTGPFSAPDAPPVLVVATTGDPATPYEWGLGLADELETAVLVSVEGDSHTAYGSGNSCVDDVVDAYLLELDVPDGQVDC